MADDDNSSTLTQLSGSFLLDSYKKNLISNSTFRLMLSDNNNSGNLKLTDEASSILKIVYPDINLNEIQAELNSLYEDTDNPKPLTGEQAVSIDYENIIEISENHNIQFINYKHSINGNIIIEILVNELTEYKK